MGFGGGCWCEVDYGEVNDDECICFSGIGFSGMVVYGFVKRIFLGVVCWEFVDWSLVVRCGNRWEVGVGGGLESSVGS